jgi:Protein of unknown function (DUF1552)
MAAKPALANRRFFLKSAGATVALPLLESLSPRALRAGLALGASPGAPVSAERPVRLVCVGNMLGFYAPAFFPKKAGADYDLPPLLEPLAAHRADLTVFSGLDHGVKGGHFAIHAFLSGVRTADAKGMPEGNISLDQRAAEAVGGATRFPSLAIGSEDGIHGGCQMCWTRAGTRVPPVPTPRELFRKLFVTDTANDRNRAADRLRLQGSILDAVRDDARALDRRLGQQDREKLGEYLASVRDVERQLQLNKQWADVPKPKAGIPEPENKGMVADLPVIYDLIALALQTDSTRIATLEIAGGFLSQAFGIRKEYHALSHHGMVQENIDGLLKVETYQTEQFARFLGKLKATSDGSATLLDHTMVLFGSGMGNANSHTNMNLPVILAGGGFKHGRHRAFPQSGPGRAPLSNLYLSLLHRFGVDAKKFGPSAGTLAGLEVA